MSYVLWFIGVIIIVLWVLLRPARYTKELASPFFGVNHAHRGLHTRDRKIPENSLPAFAAAAQMGYGMELDVQLSKDGQVVVFHDDTLKRVCGVEGRVDAFTLEELRAMRLCGTEDGIPLFTEVLALVNGRVPMIVELKTGPRRVELCEAVLPLLRAYQGAYCVESFDPRIVGWFAKHAPDILRGQLSDSTAHFIKDGQSKWMSVALGNLFTNVVARPQFIAYGSGEKSIWVKLVEAMGALRVCWTVRDNDDIEEKERENDVVIFEFYTPPVRFRT